MPVMRGEDSEGYFYRYGKSGKKYYYNPNKKQSREKAKHLASIQGKAVKAQQNK